MIDLAYAAFDPMKGQRVLNELRKIDYQHFKDAKKDEYLKWFGFVPQPLMPSPEQVQAIEAEAQRLQHLDSSETKLLPTHQGKYVLYPDGRIMSWHGHEDWPLAEFSEASPFNFGGQGFAVFNVLEHAKKVRNLMKRSTEVPTYKQVKAFDISSKYRLPPDVLGHTVRFAAPRRKGWDKQ